MVVVNRSFEAKGALQWALSHAVQSQDTVVLLRVTNPCKQGGNSHSVLNQRATHEILCSMESMCQAMRPGVQVERVVQEGKEKGAEIVEAAKQHRVNLLVLGKRKRSMVTVAVRRKRVQSEITNYCIQNADCMTVAVRRKSRKSISPIKVKIRPMGSTSKAMCLSFLVVAILVYSCPTNAQNANVSTLQFYMHDIVSGPNPTAVRVAGPPPSNASTSNPLAAIFGSIYVFDDPLTATPELNSTLVGRAQGLYAAASLSDEFALQMTVTYAFVSGPYNGSSITVAGRNPVMRDGPRELPVVGGTGAFRLARGYCLANTYSMDEMDAVIGYNVTIIHY
nr:dirigent protein 22-like [Ipomoea batatas]